MPNKKQILKLYEKQCYFCGENNYNLLDVHRIFEGKDGGKYHPLNNLVLCANCHRKVHSGEIKTIRKYLSSNGKYVLNYIENDIEKWK